MSRFVFVSFAFLGWAFFELSGGTDFKPPERLDTTAKSTETEVSPGSGTRTVQLAAYKPTIAARVAPRVATVAAKPTAPITAQALPEEELAETPTRLNLSLGTSLDLFPTTNNLGGLRLASLEQGAAGLTQDVVSDETPEIAETPTVIEPLPDLREITGTRVNMRQGPGTNYPILMRLSLGHEVQVLDDSGTGWLRLRVLPDRTMGWIAASLVSKKRP